MTESSVLADRALPCAEPSSPAAAELGQRAMPLGAAAAREVSVLLVQVRDEPRALHHERLCFLERLQLPPERVKSVNVVGEGVPELSEALDASLVILGGAGRHSAFVDYPFTSALGRLVEGLVAAGHPFFGSCFGHQFMARVLGGSVITDPAGEEVGTFDIELTAEGRRDPLFEGYPERFPVHLGHHDRIERLPAGLVTLASSELCHCQVIRVEGKPAYGTQFHCEMSAQHMRERLLMYQAEYMPGEDALALFERRLRPTTLVDALLARFVELYAR